MSYNNSIKLNPNYKIIEFLNKNNIKNFNINNNMIDINDDLILNNLDLQELPYKFNVVNGNVKIMNSTLKSFKNFPNVINGNLILENNVNLNNSNSKLSNIVINGNVILDNNFKVNFEFSKIVGDIKTSGNYNYIDKKNKPILKEYNFSTETFKNKKIIPNKFINLIDYVISGAAIFTLSANIITNANLGNYTLAISSALLLLAASLIKRKNKNTLKSSILRTNLSIATFFSSLLTQNYIQIIAWSINSGFSLLDEKNNTKKIILEKEIEINNKKLNYLEELPILLNNLDKNIISLNNKKDLINIIIKYKEENKLNKLEDLKNNLILFNEIKNNTMKNEKEYIEAEKLIIDYLTSFLNYEKQQQKDIVEEKLTKMKISMKK